MGVSPYILPEDLPRELQPKTFDSGQTGLYDREKRIWEKSLFERTLRQTGGNKPEAARRLGFNTKHFYARCKELGV
jgi:DNA-binding NtrC family response regulator